MQRRSILKSIGAASAAGVSIGFGDIVEAADSSELVKRPLDTARFEFDVKDADEQFPLVASCQSFARQRYDKKGGNFLLSKKVPTLRQCPKRTD